MAQTNIVEDSEKLPEFSLHLSRVFDDIGLNTLTVQRRRHAFLFAEHFTHVCMKKALQCKKTKHSFGSQVEGTTTPGLNSDVDILFCDDIINVIQDLKEWIPSRFNVLMLEDNVAPGYCKLQVMNKDESIPDEWKPEELFQFHMHDVSGQILLKNSFLNETPEFNETRNGPATTVCGVPGSFDKDIVNALKYKHWPRQAEEFIMRKRRGSWPSKSLIQQVIKHGVFLVPVGHKLSSTEEGELEWRISASMAERCLMFSLNIVQIKVYVALKMLVKIFIQPVVSNSISSYHCKTVVLYSIEQTTSRFWRENNLVKCIRKCLVKLLNCIENVCCPHFIISKENLFDGKVTSHNKCTLLSILSYLIPSVGRDLFRITFDRLGQHLETSIANSREVNYIQDSSITVCLVGMAEYFKNIDTANCKVNFLVAMNSFDTELAFALALCQHSEVVNYLATLSDETELEAVQSFAEFLLCWIGSMHSSFMLSSSMDMHPDALYRITSFRDSSNVTHLLKLASVLYCNGKYNEAESTLNTTLDCYQRHRIRAVCDCSDRSNQGIDVVFCRNVYDTITNRTLRSSTTSSMFAQCVMFSKQESYCTPNALRYEYFRSIGDDIKFRNPDKDCWVDLAIVDCLPLYYYLCCITYNKLQKYDIQKQSLTNLKLCAKWDITLGHPETAWNLAGACCENAEAAMYCFKKSIEIAPRNNAANWHLSTLVYNLMRDNLTLLSRISLLK